MATRKPKGLGRGLDSLLGEDTAAITSIGKSIENGLQEIAISKLKSGKYQPRTKMEQVALEELSESIKVQGVIQPILIRPIESKGKSLQYEIIAGERRVQASKLAGLKTVPAIVRDIQDENAALIALIENIQREDLNAIEEAQAIKRLLEEFELTHDDAAQAIGRSRSATSNLLRLLTLGDAVQKMLLENDIDMGHARALLPLELEDQVRIANLVYAKKLSVRETEKIVKDLLGNEETDSVKTAKKVDQDLVRLETILADRLGTMVRIKPGKGQKGRIEVNFENWEHLQGVLETLGFKEELEGM
ncbi:ParB/RepB/Spo0J family partition protein [Orrella sp. 11846]|uniref:ParB/RepB/Spo0J family partition protein n=1 Tax=Orrella sp. 11846 TaxID=3409913 RepID=UPI003B5AD318